MAMAPDRQIDEAAAAKAPTPALDLSAPDQAAIDQPAADEVRPRRNRRRKKTPAQIKPSRRLELRYIREGYALILGVDEVGVASASGPVFACALAMPLNKRLIKGVRDSKTLSAAERERLEPKIRRQALRLGIGAASVAEIDRLNIYHATHLAMRRAIARAGAHDFVIVDGNRIRGFEEHAGPYRAMVDADALCYVVSCASIVAKVARDGLMRRLAQRYPGYGWEHNAGYPTPDHRRSLAELGVTPHHRRSFITVKRIEFGDQLTLGVLEESQIEEQLIVVPIEAAELVGVPAG